MNQPELHGTEQHILDTARGMIKAGNVSCVAIQKNQIVYSADGRGVAPLIKLYQSEPQKMENALIVDKIIGKAAAMILVLGGATKVYGEVMSEAAQEYLKAKGVSIGYGRCVNVIASRDGTGICPIERSVLEIDDPAEGLQVILAKIQSLQKVG